MGLLSDSTGHSLARQGEKWALDSENTDHRLLPLSEASFWSVVQDSAREALKNALGDVILGILTGQKMLENPEDTNNFTEKLKTVFGTSGAKTIEFVITKELYKRLSIPFDPDGLFDYASFLEAARKNFSNRNRSRNAPL